MPVAPRLCYFPLLQILQCPDPGRVLGDGTSRLLPALPLELGESMSREV